MLDEELIITLGRVVVALTGTTIGLEEENKGLLSETVVENLGQVLKGTLKKHLMAKLDSMFNCFPVKNWETEVDRMGVCLVKIEVDYIEKLKEGILKVCEKTLTAFRSDLNDEAVEKLLAEIEARL